MPINILMPALSPTMEEGTLTRWHKAEGDEVEAGDVIAEIETDKATMEFEAVEEGTIGKILISEGTGNVKVNTPIAVLLEEGESADDIDLSETANENTSKAESGPAPEEKQEDENVEDKSETSKAAAPKQDKQPTNDQPKSDKGGRIFASPLAKRLAKEAGIDLADIKGSGPRGRIVKADIEAVQSGEAPKKTAAAAPAEAAPAMPSGAGPDAKKLADMLDIPYRAEANSGMRKTIAKRLVESKQTVPHYYLSIECKLDELMALRKQINDQADGAYKISVNDFIIKATALALKSVPAANTSWTDAETLYYERADVSVAVATDAGLITPIIKGAENKSLSQISTEMKDLAGRARDGKLKPEEYQGGTCSVSNLGMFGIKSFSAIINPPQSAIIAVGAGETRPSFDDEGNVVPMTFMTATGSFDHRSIDGAVGAEFLAAFKGYLENPFTMLV
ncbi:MAG: pyruvate dehydrogenase complex dihydrolipoamide acetyltransferase [Pseudomonadota bacterium]